MADLLINGKDALTEYGVRMGDGFLDKLGDPAPLKDYIKNSCRLKDGVNYAKVIPKLDERSLTLTFYIEGKDKADFIAKKKAFLAVLYAGDVKICVPQDSPDVYKLKYTGKNVTFAKNVERTFAKMSVGFQEPNPADRTETATTER